MATAQGTSRRLTIGEIAMSRRLFGNSINYDLVKVHNAEYLPFGMQRNDTVMTPNGEIYYPKDLFREDFSLEDLRYRHLFMHEMVHVWQKQMGMNVWFRGLGSGFAKYRYTLSANKKFSSYGMEQQASLLSDYYILIYHGEAVWRSLKKSDNSGPDVLALYQAVLSNFLKNPADRSILR